MNIDTKICPDNLLEWGNFEDWENGASAAPTNHTLNGTGATIARENTIVKQGLYSAKLTRNGGDCDFTYTYTGYAAYQGHRMTLGAWVYATVANRARLELNDGVGANWSSYHTGDGTWQWLTVTLDIASSVTAILCHFIVDTGDTSAYFDGAVLVDGSMVFTDLSNIIETWEPARTFRFAQYVAARRPGQIIPSVEYDLETLQLVGNVVGSTPQAARTAYDTLIQGLSNGLKNLFLYDDRLIKVYLTSEDHNYQAAARSIPFTLGFTAPNPFFQYLNKTRVVQAIASSPTSFTVVSNGTVYAKPVLNFIAGGSSITSLNLQNLTTGQVMNFTGTVTAWNTLVIDTDAATILNNGVDGIAYFTGDFLQLNPGTNILKFTGSNCTIKVDFFDRFL